MFVVVITNHINSNQSQYKIIDFTDKRNFVFEFQKQTNCLMLCLMLAYMYIAHST